MMLENQKLEIEIQKRQFENEQNIISEGAVTDPLPSIDEIETIEIDEDIDPHISQNHIVTDYPK